LSYWNAQPPGCTCGRFTCQSPGTKTCRAIIQSEARRRVGLIRGKIALDQCVDGERGVPHWRGAGLVVEHLAVLDGERLDLLELPQHERVIVGIAEQPHRQDRVRHRRIDAAEPARHGQTLLEPEARRLDRAAAQGACEKRSQILRPSSTAMKKLFQKRPRQLKGSGTRENRRLVSSRGTGHSSSSER